MKYIRRQYSALSKFCGDYVTVTLHRMANNRFVFICHRRSKIALIFVECEIMLTWDLLRIWVCSHFYFKNVYMKTLKLKIYWSLIVAIAPCATFVNFLSMIFYVMMCIVYLLRARNNEFIGYVDLGSNSLTSFKVKHQRDKNISKMLLFKNRK